MENINDWSYKYQKALEVLKQKLNVLYQEYSKNDDNNPIEHIKYRIKSPKSIKEKIIKKVKESSDLTLEPENIVLTEKLIDEFLCDIVGVRIVCSFKDDLNKLINVIKNDKDIQVLEEKNYIEEPKRNGYKSYHFKVAVPVIINGEKKYVKSEIQLRTIAMDMCASIEHIIYYKKNIILSDKAMEDLQRTVQICDSFDNMLNDYIKKIKDLNLEKKYIDLNQISDKEFNNLLPKYNLALDILRQKIYSMVDEYKANGSISPIEHINSRIKNKEKIIRKLQNQGIEVNINNIEEYITDIAAIRVVCPFKKDIYEIIEKIKEDKDIKIIKEKDYITNPKDSGYRSYHLIALVPIHTDIGILYVKTEIQIRSMVMDMWASLQRKLCYQKEDYPEIKQELKRNADMLEIIDNTLDEMREESKELIEARKYYMNIKKRSLKKK